jgi:predicted permease
MEAILAAILPVMSVVALGAYFKHIDFPGGQFWERSEKLTYYLLLPCLFFYSVADADFTDLSMVMHLVGALGLAMLLVGSLAFALRPMLRLDGPSFASFFQGSIRFNNYVGLPIIMSMFGREGVAVYAIMIALAIPLSNALTVIVMARYSAHQPLGAQKLAKAVAGNPLIFSSVLGIGFNLLGLSLGPFEGTITLLANASLALGLFTVGVGIDLHVIKGAKATLVTVNALKLIVNPLVVYGCCKLMGVEGRALAIAMVYAVLPVAASSYILAKKFNANAGLMAAITVSTVLCSAAALSIMLWLITHFTR